MSCEALQDIYELYALGVAEDPERGEIREHLHRGCETCLAGVKRARQLAAMVGAAVDQASPRPELKRRILASAGYEQQRFRWAVPAFAAAAVLALCVVVYSGGRERRLSAELAHLQLQAGRQSVELARLNEAFAILNGPDTAEVSFGRGQPAPPKGKVFVNPAQGVLLLASNLPPAPSGKTYEMWVIPKGGKPVPAGLFQSATDGSAIHIRRGAVDLASTGAVAVTLENEGGAPQPTSQPLIVAPLS